MKTRDLESMLLQAGFALVKCSKHKVYSNGYKLIPLPHHKEINMHLAKKIIKQMQEPIKQLEMAA